MFDTKWEESNVPHFWIVNEKNRLLAGPFSEKINAESELLDPKIRGEEGGPGWYHHFGEPKVIFGIIDWDTKIVTEQKEC